MRRLFVLLAAVGLLGGAVGCLTMGKCDCDENIGCGSCGICSGAIHHGPVTPKEVLPKPMPKDEKPKEGLGERAEESTAPTTAEPAPAN